MAVWEKYLEYLRDQKRYAAHTVRAYQGDLLGYIEYLSEVYGIDDPAQAGTEMLRSYIVRLLEDGLSRRSVHRKVSAIKSMYRYLMRFHGLGANPAEGLVLPRPAHDLPVFLTGEAMERLLGLLPEPVDPGTARERMLLTLLYSTGMRVSELCGLDRADVVPGRHVVRVLGKRNKQRDIPLGAALETEMERYLVWRDSVYSG
ncbi:MAG TPA: site-specific integrase, partial [Bacteroidales bacterium]|nr:site-specific integrase [Bacteroidales bacterium]